MLGMSPLVSSSELTLHQTGLRTHMVQCAQSWCHGYNFRSHLVYCLPSYLVQNLNPFFVKAYYLSRVWLSYVQPLNIMGYRLALATHWLRDIRKNPNVLRLLCVPGVMLVWLFSRPGPTWQWKALHLPGNWVISLGSPVNLWSDNHYFSLWGILLSVHCAQYSCAGRNQNKT